MVALWQVDEQVVGRWVEQVPGWQVAQQQVRWAARQLQFEVVQV